MSNAADYKTFGQEPTGVVLAGGRSSRLGHDKAQVRFQGEDLLCRAVALLSGFFPEVWVVGRDPRLHGVDVPWKLDDVAGKGPAGGIMTALRVTGRACMVISCDMPFLDNRTIARLLRAWEKRRESHLMTTYMQVETGFIESLVAIYELKALPRLEKYVAEDKVKLSRIFPPEMRCNVLYSRDEARPFFNVNYPADLAVMKELERAL